MYAKGIKKWQKRPPRDRIKWAELSAHMVKDYNTKLTKMGVATMGKEGYGTSMHDAEELTDRNSLTEAVTKYAERAIQ